ncbi:J domain-containing protein [Sphingomonas astaxanthinifaciens]|uniref:J domain-containing protein n=1 Tax=Sphingomonas astaxanthinifaciens DSM 22298 TaxID=1123267 RepID=A0ABQ5Z3A4_9SPHN|nr:J domain-containing protein [Sphingomonas astaxanthinifaciens]GLR46485.1 hypothetical protein GCM10007925_01960 [Sphingomonas astaxanthinifaciens DSM 22298]
MEAAPDYYAILGVGEDADGAAIRMAYRTLMRRYHPDVNATDEAAAKAIAINQAYACLSSDERRADYDRSRRPPRPRSNSPYRQRTTRVHRPTPSARPTFVVMPEPEPAPARVRVAILGAALAVTLATFAMTSATPPAMTPEEIAAAQAAMAKAGAAACAGPERARDPACGDEPGNGQDKTTTAR